MKNGLSYSRSKTLLSFGVGEAHIYVGVFSQAGGLFKFINCQA